MYSAEVELMYSSLHSSAPAIVNITRNLTEGSVVVIIVSTGVVADDIIVVAVLLGVESVVVTVSVEVRRVVRVEAVVVVLPTGTKLVTVKVVSF